MTATPILRLNRLVFTGREVEQAELVFPEPVSFTYGASNTGKSFAVKAIDFMLGGRALLPDIGERRPYQRIQLDVQVGDDEPFQLERAIAGGDFLVRFADGTERTLSSRHSADSDANLSNYLLGVLGATGMEVARDKSGQKRALSFRDIVRLCIADETAIQSEASPVESGDILLTLGERNAFKYLLTGEDDSALITQVKRQDFKTGKTAQLRFIDEMIAQIDIELSEDFPDADKLDEMKEKVEDDLAAIEKDIVAARASVMQALERKRTLTVDISTDQRRVNDIAISLENFEQLQIVYASDIARLEAIEEAGFLFAMDADKNCPVCGAPPEAQVHEHGLVDITEARFAAEAEIAKIQLHQSELSSTTVDAAAELETTGERLLANREKLAAVEAELNIASPNAVDQQLRFAEVIPQRDRINRGLALISRKEDLERQRQRIEKLKQEKPKSNFQAGLSTVTAQEFANEVAGVLRAWKFPGACRVFFDMDAYDLTIDGKQRRNNGKGVRAITHAAFKVALLTYCRERNRPHPGFVILDSPLITYRDPIRYGALAPDEQEISNSDLKFEFFHHLASLKNVGQFIIFDNADPPDDADSYAHIETFTNDFEQGRQGLFKVEPRA